MAELKFETLEFKEEEEQVKVILLKQFYCELDKNELEKIGKFKIEKNKIIFKDVSQNRLENKFNFLLEKSLESLKNIRTNHPAVYFHQNSGIPLIGNVAVGIVYRNTSLIEIKPVTSCNLNCIFCSVGEGVNCQKTDFIVQREYMVEELKKLIKFIGEKVEIHISAHGEPFYHSEMVELIKDLNTIEEIFALSVDTNATLITDRMIDELADCKKFQFNLSLHTLNPKMAETLAGGPYNLKHLLHVIDYSQNKVAIRITPLLLPGHNEGDMEEVIKLAKKYNLPLGIQNFLPYKTGRNPVKPWPWPKFYDYLRKLEKKYEIKLVLKPEDFDIRYTKKLPLPFVEGDIVPAVIACSDRFPHSRMAVAKERTVSIPDCDLPLGKKVKVKIIRDKHNIFGGRVV